MPLLVVPLFADQPDNADRVAAVGAGQVVLPGPALGERVQSALEAVLANSAFGEGAARIAREIAALPPVDEVVSALPGPAGLRR